MVTGDKDFGQLVTPNIKVYDPLKKEILGVEEVNAKYGIQTPTQLIDILGLMGDSADNIPGCPGVGPKTAEKLIQQFGSIENLLEHTDELKGAQQQKVRDNADQIRMSKWLATIITDVPVTLEAEASSVNPPIWKPCARCSVSWNSAPSPSASSMAAKPTPASTPMP